MKIQDVKFDGALLHVTFAPENVKESELLGGAAGALEFEPGEQAALDIEEMALALGFQLPNLNKKE